MLQGQSRKPIKHTNALIFISAQVSFLFFLISLQRKRNCFWCNTSWVFKTEAFKGDGIVPQNIFWAGLLQTALGREGDRSCSWEYKILKKNLGHKQMSNNVTIHKAVPRNLMNSQLWRTVVLKNKTKQKLNRNESLKCQEAGTHLS